MDQSSAPYYEYADYLWYYIAFVRAPIPNSLPLPYPTPPPLSQHKHEPPQLTPLFPLQLVLCTTYMVLASTFFPTPLARQLYLRHTNITAPGLRIWTPWMLISTGVRVGLLLHFGDRGWHDASMITLAAAVWYWNVEYWFHGTVLNSQYVTSMLFDVTGLVWLWVARDAVTGGSG